MKTVFSTPCLISLALLSICRTSFSEPVPLGYERWTYTENLSGAVFQQPPAWYYGTYTDLFKLGSFPDARPPAPNRLVDIELRKSSGSDIVMDGLWVANDGDFKADSWLVLGLTSYDLFLIDTIEEFFFLDIEAYESAWGLPTKYAAILKRNPHRFKKMWLPEVTKDVLIKYVRDDQWRPIDIDVLHNDGLDPADQSAWNNVRYNAIFVENTGLNFKPTVVSLENETRNAVNDAIAGGLQPIDIEPMLSCTHVVQECPVEVNRPCEQTCGVGTIYSTIYVHNGLPYELIEAVGEPSISDVFNDLSDRYTRSIDIETSANGEPMNPDSLHSVFVH